MRIAEFLRSRHVPFQTLLHSPAPTAMRRAQSIHVPGMRVAKSVLLLSDGRYVLAVLPATHRVELPRLAGLLGAKDIRLATEDEVELVFDDCERGAMPPFGSLYGLKTLVDATLACGADVVLEGNTRHEDLRLRFRDFEAIERPTRGRFAAKITPRHRRTNHRRAG